jgi:tRNA pseudouridine13 synthase
VDLKVAELPFPVDLDASTVELFRNLSIPLPASRNAEPVGPLGDAAREVLEEFSLSWTELRVRYLKDVFFSKGTRPAFLYPRELKTSRSDDELHPGRSSVTLSFELGKGSYATILVKRLTEVAARTS